VSATEFNKIIMSRNQPTSPTTWVEFIHQLISTRRGLITIGFILAAFILVLSLTFYLWRPDQVEVTTNAGTITIKKGSTQNAVVMVSASGSTEKGKSPWTQTGIIVKKDDKIKIQASGRVHTALKKLITIAETDQQILPSWVGPGGSDTNRLNDWDSKRASYKLMPDRGTVHGYGKLIAAIWREEKAENLKAVGEGTDWDIKEGGELVFAVNDILLTPDARDIYALPPKENYLYYKTRIEEEDNLREKNGESIPNKPLNERIIEAYKKRLATWDEDIFKNNNWMVWYEDNIGAFSVSVTIN